MINIFVRVISILNSKKENHKYNFFNKHQYVFVIFLVLSAFYTTKTKAQTPVSVITTNAVGATSSSYTEGGTTYKWGQGSDLFLESIGIGGNTYSYDSNLSPTRFEIIRVDAGHISTGFRTRLMVQTGSSATSYEATYPAATTDGSRMEAALKEPIINRGALDVFHNVESSLPSSQHANNIERIDILYNPITAPATGLLDEIGFLVSEKNGNNDFKIAAVTAVDPVTGDPSAYGPLVLIALGDYGEVDGALGWTFLENAITPPQGEPISHAISSEQYGISYVSFAELGITANDIIYGISVFGKDVNNNDHNLLDPSTFPTNTSEGADIHGGLGSIVKTNNVVITNLPIALDDSNTTPQDVTLTITAANGLLNNDLDPDGGTLSVTQFMIGSTTYNVPANGSATANLTEEGALTINSDGSYVFVPVAGFVGNVPTAVYTISNGNGGAATARLNIEVLLDTDGDGYPNRTDLDDDNDGILDTNEGCTDTNLIVNGDFEANDFTDAIAFPNGFTFANGTFIGTNYNNNNITGWTRTENLDGWVEGGTWANAYSGNQYIDVIGNMSVGGGATVPANKLSQLINTVPGSDYTLSFYWGDDVGHNGVEIVTLLVDVFDSSNQVLANETLTKTASGPTGAVRGPNQWFYYTVTFRATTNQTKIQFSTVVPGNGDVSAGAALDFVSVIKCTDTDQDGIPDSLDTDSDGDGCPDAIEAAGAFTSTNLDANARLTGTVNNNGVPTVAGVGQANTNDVITDGPDLDGDGIADACDAIDDRTDTDKDGVPDITDLDDDNDGVLDVIEQNCGLINTIDDFNAPLWNYGTGNGGDAFGTGTLNGVPFTMDFNANGGVKLFTSTSQYTSNSTLGHGGNSGSLLLGGSGESITFTFDSPITIIIGFDHLNFGNDGWLFDTPASEIVSLGKGHEISGNINSIDGVNNVASFPANTTTISRFKWSNITTLTITTAGLPFTTIGLSSIISHCDTDNDGIPDYLDTDSDNDGCPDALEAAGSFTTADLTVDNNLANLPAGVDAITGIPTVAGAGQANTEDVITDGPDIDNDGVANACDDDDDNDGNPDSSDPNPAAPTTSPDTGSADPGVTTKIDILGNDDYLDNLDAANLGTTTIVDAGTGTAAGTITFDADSGELIYTPTAGEAGTTVTVDYTVCNTNPDPDVCSTNTVTITVNDPDTDQDGNPDSTDPNPNAPTTAPDTGSVDPGVATKIDILGNDDYLDNLDTNNVGTTTIVDAGTGTAGGTITFDTDSGELIYTPTAGEAGTTVTVAYTVCNTDPNPDVCSTNTVTITVGDPDTDQDGNPDSSDPNPNAPTTAPDTGLGDVGVATKIDILGNDDYLDNLDTNNVGTITIVDASTGTAGGTITFDADTGELIYTPIAGEAGTTVTVDYTVCNTDPNPDVCSTNTVTITVSDPDSDGDGVTDSQELADNTNPNDPCNYNATSQIIENVSDDWNAMDCDGDGVTNGIEITDSTDPLDMCDFVPESRTLNPSDAWNIGDCDNDGQTNKDEWDSNGDGNGPDDCDNDSIPDFLDTDVCKIEIPKLFTPNGDGINDVFEIPHLANLHPSFEMKIFNRWGNIVYDYKNKGKSQPDWWDGFSTGRMTINDGKRVPTGTYFYIINLKNGNKEPQSGWIYLNR